MAAPQTSDSQASTGHKKRKRGNDDSEAKKKKPKVVDSANDRLAPKTAAPTITRLSKQDRAALTEANKSIFVALPKSLKKHRAAAVTSLRKFVVDNVKYLTRIIQAGDSFLAVVLDTTQHRDKALEKLRHLEYRHQGEKISLTLSKFGTQENSSVAIWTVQVGPLDTAGDLLAALKALFQQHSSVPPFQIAPRHLGVPNGTFSILFQSPPPWCDKKVEVGQPPQSRLITAEQTRRCRFCKEDGHHSWACSGKAELTLGTVEASSGVER